MKTLTPLPPTRSIKGPALFPILSLIGLAIGLVYFGWITDRSFFYCMVAIFGVAFLILSFFSIQTGLILMTLAMLFSPEITIGTIGLRELTIRIEDVLIPILAMAWLARLAIRKEFQLIASNPLNKPILILILVSIGSTIWGISQEGTTLLPALFYFLKTIEFFTIFFLVTNYVRSAGQIRFFLYFSLFTVALIGIYTLFQVPNTEIFTEHRITAPFEGVPQPASVGGYMMFLLLILLGLILYDRHSMRRLFYVMAAGVTFIPFLFTFNRTSYASLVAGLLLISFLSKKPWVFGCLFIFLLTSPLWSPRAVKARIAFTWEDGIQEGRELGVDQSFEERIGTYKKMWNSAKGSPVIGWGVGSYDYLDSQYARTFHEIGAVGLGIWLWIFFRLYRISRWLFKALPDGPMKGLTLGYTAGLVGILVHAFGVVPLYIIRSIVPFWFVTALVVSLYTLKVKEEAS